MGPGIVVKQSQLKPGRIDSNLVSSRPKGTLLVKTGWHPWWRVNGASVKMKKTGHGLLQLTDLPVGKVSLTLTWEPPRYPQYLSLFGWLLFLGLWVRFRQNDGRDTTQSSG